MLVFVRLALLSIGRHADIPINCHRLLWLSELLEQYPWVVIQFRQLLLEQQHINWFLNYYKSQPTQLQYHI
ncbi:hypothetical protein N0V85_006247 [Neurospora sp. IMI 360204]|nr:hypothetical protein N0V85_006247 [Neurospora sp. IMI 360204]